MQNIDCEVCVCLQDCAEEAGTTVTGGQTVVNPWLTIGGVATTVCQPNEFILWDGVFWLVLSLFLDR